MRAGTEVRAIADEDDARGCLSAMEASGTGLSAWARQNGVEPASLYRWRQLVAGRDGVGIADAGEARRLLDAWGRSGRSFAEWCRGERVSMDALRGWRRRLESQRRVPRPEGRRPRQARPSARALPVTPIRLVEITTSAGVAGPPVEAPAPARYEIQVGRCRVLVGTDFDDAVLIRLLRVASAC